LKYPYSQASISQQFILENLSRKYKLPDKKVIQLGLSAFQGGWFETIKKGTYENVSLYDINSAYPDIIRQLPALDNGIWIKNECYDPDAVISLFKVSLKCNSDLKISPVKYFHPKLKRLIYPVGNFETVYINKKEYEAIQEFYKIKIMVAYHFKTKDIERPFSSIETLYNKRVNMKKTKSGNQMMVKIAINGCYGKYIQLIKDYKDLVIKDGKHMNQLLKSKNVKIEDDYIRPDGQLMVRTYEGFKAGLMFNPIYAQEITADTRMKIFNALKNIQDDIINIATDGIMTTKKPKNIKIDKYELGAWDYEIKNKTITVLGSGMYTYPKDNRYVVKFRGFDSKINLNQMLHDNKNKDIINISLNRPLKMKKLYRLKSYQSSKNVVLQHKDIMQNMNLFTNQIKSVNINFDIKRNWDRKFKNCNDILKNQIDSKPINI